MWPILPTIASEADTRFYVANPVLPDPQMVMLQGHMLADDYGSAYREAPAFHK